MNITDNDSAYICNRSSSSKLGKSNIAQFQTSISSNKMTISCGDKHTTNNYNEHTTISEEREIPIP